MALPGTAPLPLDIAIEGVPVLSGGAPVDHDVADLEQRVAGREVVYEVGLPGEGADTEVFFSDLGHAYVTLNAEYTT
jgi:glutamate N-acetyltransferase/amino-acid N-acetyltransferase